MRTFFSIVAAFVLAAIAANPLAAQQPGYVKAGVLTCNVAPTIGLILGSQQNMSCSFSPDYPGLVPENYYGTITRLGLDIGITAGGIMIWGVFAPSSGYPVGALAGAYVGASGSISLGVGGDANILLGGSNRTVALQPLSVEGRIGINLALGVAGLELRSAR